MLAGRRIPKGTVNLPTLVERGSETNYQIRIRLDSKAADFGTKNGSVR
jgi:hypothetical protein